MTPRPTALRLLTTASGPVRVKPPFGIKAWTDDASALAIVIDASAADITSPASVGQQIPPAETLPPETPVVVLEGAATGAASWRQWLDWRVIRVPRSARCAALLARGYVAIGAGPDAAFDLAWGWTSLRR